MMPRISFPSPVPGLGHFNQALMGHSCQAPKGTGERLLSPDTGDGFIWRIRSVARYEERDGGVYLELEAMAPTRDIPASLAWLVSQVVNHLSINSLVMTLRQTRDVAISSRVGAGTVASVRFRPAAPKR